MTRGMAMLLTLLTLAFAMFAGWYSGQRTDYFPASLQTASAVCVSDLGDINEQQVLDEFEDLWLSDELSAFGEPSLYRRPSSAPPSIRLTWIRSFHDPIVVRVDTTADGRSIMTARRRPGGLGFRPSEGIDRNQSIVRQLSAAEATALQKAIDDVGLFNAPASGCRCCVDGSLWLIEAADPQHGYRFRSRQSPKGGLERALGLHLLALTGWDPGRIY